MNLKAFNESVGFLASISSDTARIPLVVRDLDGNEVQLQGVEVEWRNRMQDCSVVLRLAPGMRLDETNPEAVVEAASEQAEPEEIEWPFNPPGLPEGWRVTAVTRTTDYKAYYQETPVGRISMVGSDFDFVPTTVSGLTAKTRGTLKQLIWDLEAERRERVLSNAIMNA